MHVVEVQVEQEVVLLQSAEHAGKAAGQAVHAAEGRHADLTRLVAAERGREAALGLIRSNPLYLQQLCVRTTRCPPAERSRRASREGRRRSGSAKYEHPEYSPPPEKTHLTL